MMDAVICQECGSEWDDGPIPGTRRRATRLLAERDPALDVVVAWQCPDCLTRWEHRPRAVTHHEENQIAKLMEALAPPRLNLRD